MTSGRRKTSSPRSTDHQVLQRRRHRRGHHRQGRPGRGPARHRLQDRRRHPLPRTVDQARRRPERGRQRRRSGRGPGSPEGGQGRPSDPLEEARPVREGVGHHREDQGRGRRRHRYRHRGRQGWSHPRHRPAWLPAGVAGRDAPGPRPPAVRRPGDRGQDHRAGQEPQQRGPVPPGVAGADPVRGADELPHPAAEGPDPQGRRLLDRQLRCVRGPRWRRRSGARVRAVLEAHRPPDRGGRGRPGGHRRGAGRRHGPRARLAVAEGDPGRPVAAVRPDPPDGPDRARQGHQAGSVRCVRPGGGGHRGSGPHLRAGRASRRDPGAGRPGQRRHRWSRSSTSTSSVAGSRCR